MNRNEWERLEKTVNRKNTALETAFIVDSPWIPGYCGRGIVDFFARPDVWLQSYDTIKADFPGVILIPDHWVEFGMATEPSSFGCRIEFFQDNLPIVHHTITSIDEFEPRQLKLPNPKTSGLAPIALNLQKYAQEKIASRGEDIYIVASRGPLTLSSHLMGLTELMIGLKVEPDKVHALLLVASDYCINWLNAQLENVKNAKGVLVLDDVTGFLGENDYLEFAHPYLKKIFDAFPEMMHLYHNDTDSDVCYPHLQSMGVDVFNFSHNINIARAREKTGERICLMGNVPPMALANETPDTVRTMTETIIRAYCSANGGNVEGLLMSPGGGMPMGANRENITALIEYAERFRMT